MNRRAWGSRLFAAFIVALLHGALLALFLLAVIRPRQNTVLEKPVEISLNAKHEELRLPPPLVKLEAPRNLDVALPHFDVVPESPASVSTSAQDGPSKVAGSGNGGQGTRKAPPPPPPPDPHCDTTIEAYNQLVHNAIERYVRYSQSAELRGIEGTVTLHSISDPNGQVLVHSVAASIVTRTLIGKTIKGSRVPVMFLFQRSAAAQWNYRATISADSGTLILGQGTLGTGPDGLLRAAGADPGTIAFPVPAGMTGDLASSNGNIVVEIGKAEDLFVLEESTTEALKQAQPLPKIPACLHLQVFNALIGPFGFQIELLKRR